MKAAALLTAGCCVRCGTLMSCIEIESYCHSARFAVPIGVRGGFGDRRQPRSPGNRTGGRPSRMRGTPYAVVVADAVVVVVVVVRLD